MKAFFRHFKFSAFVTAILCIALGAAILIKPQWSQTVFCYAFGAILLLCGILQVASYLVGQKKGLLNMLMMAGGIVAAVAGVAILLAPNWVLPLTVIVMGVLLLYHGAMDIKYAFDMKSAQGKAGIPLLFGLLTCAVGILLLVNPFRDRQELLFIICGMGFIFDGVTDVYTVSAVAHTVSRHELKQAAAQQALKDAAFESLSAPAEESPAPAGKKEEENVNEE